MLQPLRGLNTLRNKLDRSVIRNTWFLSTCALCDLAFARTTRILGAIAWGNPFSRFHRELLSEQEKTTRRLGRDPNTAGKECDTCGYGSMRS